MLLAAGEIHQCEWKFFVTNYAQVGLDAAPQEHACFGFAPCDDIQKSRLLGEKIQHGPRRFRRGKQVDVADYFAMPPQTAGRTATNDRLMRAQRLEKGIRQRQRFANQVP